MNCVFVRSKTLRLNSMNVKNEIFQGYFEAKLLIVVKFECQFKVAKFVYICICMGDFSIEKKIIKFILKTTNEVVTYTKILFLVIISGI